jgi:hypothetical protein
VTLTTQDPRPIVAAVAIAGWIAITAACVWRARFSRYPSLLWTCAGYMTLLHAIWIWGLLSSQMMSNGFGTVELLTFPWSAAVIFNMAMAGFRTLPDLLLNYARFILGFGGAQCLVLTLFVWELRPRPRLRQRPNPRTRKLRP